MTKVLVVLRTIPYEGSEVERIYRLEMREQAEEFARQVEQEFMGLCEVTVEEVEVY